MLTLLLTALALAAPPSSTLTGAEGTLSWTVASSPEGVTVAGEAPTWSLQHTAAADLSPKRSVHNSPANGEVTIVYEAGGASITRAGDTKKVKGANMWDGDSVDIRLGDYVSRGNTEHVFTIVDPASSKVYTMDSTKLGDATCGSTPCTHMRVQLTGILRYLGPTFEYWFDSQGKLLRFVGPTGDFAAAGAR